MSTDISLNKNIEWQLKKPLRWMPNGMKIADFDPDKLEENVIDQENGQPPLAKIPKIPGRISIRSDGRVELILEHHYDPETRQTRNKKVIIGNDLSEKLPGMMLTTDNYFLYFNRKGELVYHIPEETIEANETAETKAAAESQMTAEPPEHKQKAKQPEKDRRSETTEAQAKAESQTTAERPEHEQKEEQPENERRTEFTARPAAEPAESPKKQNPQDREKEPENNDRKPVTDESLLRREQAIREKEERLNALIRENEDLRTKLYEMKEKMDNIHMQQIIEKEEAEDGHIDLLRDFLTRYEDSVGEQAKRKPNVPMSLRQIQIINTLLSEFRRIFADCEAADYLKLADEPDPEHDIPGTTNAEMDLILAAYKCTVNSYIYGHLRTKEPDGTA